MCCERGRFKSIMEIGKIIHLDDTIIISSYFGDLRELDLKFNVCSTDVKCLALGNLVNLTRLDLNHNSIKSYGLKHIGYKQHYLQTRE